MDDHLKQSLEILKSGEVLLYPTDTIWGIGCDATQPEAVEKIYGIKKRGDRKNMVVLVNQPEMISSYVIQIPSIAWELMDAAIHPLTLIFPGAKNLATNLLADDGSIAIRVCNQTFCNTLIERFRKPIVSTSANFTGAPWPATYDDIHPDIIKSVSFVIPPHLYSPGTQQPSSIIKLGINNEVKILR